MKSDDMVKEIFVKHCRSWTYKATHGDYLPQDFEDIAKQAVKDLNVELKKAREDGIFNEYNRIQQKLTKAGVKTDISRQRYSSTRLKYDPDEIENISDRVEKATATKEQLRSKFKSLKKGTVNV